MKRFLICLSYDGTLFNGWQKQPTVRTVQGEIERALTEIAKTPISTIGSSRTDTGVHALSQYSHFDFPVTMTPLQLRLALTTKLPKDIKVLNAYIVADTFHCRFDAGGRSYRFETAKDMTPFNRNYQSYFPRHKINTANICKCLPLFMGKHDFEFFCLKDDSMNSFISDIKEIDFTEHSEGYTFTITADRFLHNMVRRIAGTLVRLSSDENICSIIAELLNKNREFLHLVYTAPPHGLYLTKVFYPTDFSVLQEDK